MIIYAETPSLINIETSYNPLSTMSYLEDINKYIEFGDIIYDDNLNIEHLGLKINKNSIKI